MARSRHPTQLALPLRRDKNGQRRGVARDPRRRAHFARLGRPPRDPTRPSERHKLRPVLDPRHPQHVTLRTLPTIGFLRTRHIYAALRRSLIAVFARTNFRIVHFSLQGNHIHLIAEATNKDALAGGVKAFSCSLAQRINRVRSRRLGKRCRGQVFADRYHAVPIRSVRQLRNTLVYVLGNARHHRSQHYGPLDYFSSAARFAGWKERATATAWAHQIAPQDMPHTKSPRSWLLRTGWSRARAISIYEAPSRDHEEPVARRQQSARLRLAGR